MTIFIFLLFYFYLFFVGRGSLILLSRLNKKHRKEINIFKSNQDVFFPIISLFVLGNILFILNFFLPLKSTISFFTIISILFLFINIFDFKRVVINVENIVNHLIIPALLSISTYGINFHGDAAGYHLNAQLWLREEPIVFGISNITWAYGFQSIFEYISSVFWIKNNFVFLHFINVIFMILFFTFLSKNLFQRKSNFLFFSSFFILGFGILDNFGVDGGKNGFVVFQSIGKFDMTFAIIFLISALLIFDSLKRNKFKDSDFHLIILLSLFAFQLKVFGIYLAIPLIYYFYFYSLNPLNLFKKIYAYFVLILLWIIKSLINTACLIYPIEFTCLNNLEWYTIGWVEHLTKDVRIFHKSYDFDDSFITWFSEWKSFGENNTTFINFFGSFLLLMLLSVIFSKRKNILTKVNFIFYIYVLFLVFIWLYSSPEIRFGISIFLLIVTTIGTSIEEFRGNFIKKLVNKTTLTFLVILSSFLVVRMDSYRQFLENPTFFYSIDIPSIEYVQNTNSWNVVPKQNIYECWINIDCVPALWTTYKSKIGNNILITSSFDSYP
tara:strand:+ start:4817 stop:6475 length:1659 start_codon:yes stop_codon:yes gene_type:complete